MTVQAAGFGLYIPIAASTTSTVEDVDSSDTVDMDYSSSKGIGFVYDSNVGKDKMYGYRLGLEYLKMDIDNVDGYSYHGDEDYKRFNVVNTFEFGLVTSKYVRFWIGPRLNIAYQSFSDNYHNESFVEFGVAPALGTNVNLGSVVSLGFDVDYRFSGLVGRWERTDYYSNDGSYTGVAKGLTARFYLLFRFGESRSSSATPTNNSDSTPSYQNDNVIDESL